MVSWEIKLAQTFAIGYIFLVTFEPNETVQNVSFAIITAGAVQGFFLGLLFLARSGRQKKEQRMPDILLSALMFVFSANIIHAAIIRPLFLLRTFTNVTLEPFQLLFGPLVYGYVRALVMPVPFRSYIRPAISTLCAFFAITAFVTLAGRYPFFAGLYRRVVDSFAWIITLAYLFHYLAKTHLLVTAHCKTLHDEFSNEHGVDLSWIRIFVIAFMIIEVLWALLLIWIIHEDISLHFGYVNALISALVVYALGFRAILQQQNVKLPATEKYGKSMYNENELAVLRERLNEVMTRDSPWIDSELNLQDLADCVGMSRHTLTEVLNRTCGMNFYDYVNSFRIEEFKRRVTMPEADSFTILAVALDSGFNSKGTFNAVFRKSTGMTPSAWRKTHRNG